MSDQVREGDETFEDASGEASSTEEKMKQKIQTLGRSYDTQSGKIVTMTTCNDDELEQFTSPELKRMAERLSTVKIIPVRVEPEILVPPAGHERGTLGAIEEAETPSPSEDREVGTTSGRVIEEKRPEAKLLQQDVPQKVFGTQEVQGDQQMSLTTPPYGSKMSPVLRGVPKPSSEMSPQLAVLLTSARGQTGSMGWVTSPSHSQIISKVAIPSSSLCAMVL
nr:uncharacterized protein LOC111834073 [Paramormyrops kingsleyae]